jgi:hypothetical protein
MAPLPKRRRPDYVAMWLAGAVFLLGMVVLPEAKLHYAALITLSMLAFAATYSLIPATRELFLAAGLSGKDLNKMQTEETPEPV